MVGIWLKEWLKGWLKGCSMVRAFGWERGLGQS